MTSLALERRLPGYFRLSLGAWSFIVWILTLTLIPFCIILCMSFMTRSEYGGVEFQFTLANYQRCFQWLYAKVLWKTAVLAFTATIGCLVLGFPVAYFLARTQGPMRQAGMVLLFIPFWTNMILRIYGMVTVLGNDGLINQILMHLGWVSEPVQILYTRTGVFLGLVYNYLPFLVVPIFSALEKLDPSLREAAADLGANRLQTFFRVVVPNVKEGIFIGSLFVFIPMLGEYVIPDILGGAKEVFLGNIMVSQFFTLQDWPFGSAIAGLLSSILLLALFLRGRWS